MRRVSGFSLAVIDALIVLAAIGFVLAIVTPSL